jgi:type IV secretion system protein VirB5
MEVHDSSMLTQIVQQVQQGAQELQTLQRQLQTLQQRVQQGHELYQSLTGARGMDQVAGLLNNPTVRSALPDNTSALLASMQSVVSSYGSISGLAQQIRQGSQIVSYPGKDWYQQEVNRIGDRHAAEMAVAQQIYQTAVTRRSALDGLRQQLASASDPATVAQLQARIQVETTQGINDLLAVNALAMQQVSNQGIDQQRKKEASHTEIMQRIQELNGNSAD